ncbi:hypothetical protein ANN_23594 [Periplaneta americana]|uniref:Uncharacterized protein n=1 Tax=Periplaneta americana TaxID=6978 RepID=A0ABQ8SMS9_PERAM|nr:hypothetical protein ANN_23594 [Periplaneta americana]
MGIKRTSCGNIIKKDLHLYPYKFTVVNAVKHPDEPSRVEFCQWFLNEVVSGLLDPQFFITSDEAWFSLPGYVNSQNMRHYASVNPHKYLEEPLHNLKIGVWCAMSGVNITDFPDYSSHTPTKYKLNLKERNYYSIEKLLSSSLLSKNLKVRIYKTVILPVVLYGCETWTLTLREEYRLRVFENKVLRKIFGAKRDEVTGEWRKLHNTELHALYSSPDIITNIKSRRLRWAGHVARMGESRNAYRVLVGRPEGKIALGRPRHRWEDNIEMDLREVRYDDRDWINLAQDRDQWRAYVRAAVNLRVP